MSKKKNRRNFEINRNIVKPEVNLNIKTEIIPEERPVINLETFDEQDYEEWKKVEIEILRDINGNCICIGSREFINENISVLPILTIPNKPYQMIRAEAIKNANILKSIGNINFKFAVNHTTFEFKLLSYDINSKKTLIQKVTKYPMEQVVFNLLAGKVLNEIRIDGNNCCYEPILKEVSVDINDITISSKNIESAIIKTSCINMKLDEYFRLERLIEFEKQDLEVELKNNNSEIFLVIAEAIRKEMSVERICEITKIDKYFIGSVYKIIKIEKELSLNYMSYKLLSKAMNIGLSLNSISYLSGKEIKDLERIISKNSI